MTSAQKIEIKIKEVMPYLQHEFGIDQIGYFGSFAKGNYTNESDLDVLVKFNKPLGWKFFDLKEYLEKLVGRKVDLVTEQSIRKQWRESILNQVKFI